MEQSIEPSSWSLLTISDCNLCALLSMVQTSESTKTLLSQLTSTLDQNLQCASTLEEAIVMNNSGLPEDMFKDTRSRKGKIGSTNNATSVGGSSGSSGNGSSNSKRNMEPGILQAAMSNLSSDIQQGESSRMAVNGVSTSTSSNSTSICTPMSTVISTPTVSMSTAASVPLASTQKALDVLSKSAHIIVCCQKPGSLSYILTVPASSTSSTPSVPTPIPTPGRRILPSPRVESSCNILNKLSGLIKQTSMKGGKGSSSKEVPKNPSQGEPSCKAPSLTSDYDAEKFSKFANILVNMDAIENSQVEGCESEEDAPGNQHNQQQLPLLTSSGSDILDADCTDSLGGETSVTPKVECVKDCEKVMDFASIVNSAVGSNFDQMSVEASNHTDDFVLPLLPEVPMSWLKVDSTDVELNVHQDASEKMEATENNEAPCVPTVASSSGTSSGTLTTASVHAHTPSSAAAMDVQIFNQPLLSSESTFTSTDIAPGPPPQPQPTANVKDETEDCWSAVDAQLHVEHIADQPMSESTPHNTTDTSDDFLNVSLDLDPESLQQLLMFSRSPESHRLSNQLQQQSVTLHPTISTDTAPLSPISQLFDRLEPAKIISSGADLDIADSHLPSEHRCDDSNENPGHSHAYFNSHAHRNLDLDFQQSIANHKNQTVNSFSSPNATKVGAPGLGSVADVANTSTIWTPSPNSLQLWLESTAGKRVHHKYTSLILAD